MKKSISLLLLSMLLAVFSFAQEGMWLLSQIDQLGLESKGLQVKTSDIYSPGQPGLYKASSRLAAGPAPSVSPEGLIVTNQSTWLFTRRCSAPPA